MRGRRRLQAPGRHHRGSGLAVLGLALWTALAGGCAGRGGAVGRLDDLGSTGAMPVFWRVDSARGAQLYVLGALHLGPAGGWDYPPAIDRAFADASALVVEVDPDDVDDRSRQLLLARYGLLPPGVRLRDRLSPGTWTVLSDWVERSGLPVDAVDRMQPWLASNMLVLDASHRLGWSPRGGVEIGLIARADERSVVPLETAEYQMAVMAGQPPALQDRMLRDSLDRFDAVEEYLSRLVAAWRVGDAEALEALTYAGYHDDPALAPFYEAVFFRRNQEMAARLRVLLDADQHRGETVFVAIGAGHLVGPRGIPAILAGWGYPVERLGRSELLAPDPTGGPVAVHP